MDAVGAWLFGLAGYPEFPWVWTGAGTGVALALTLALVVVAAGLVVERERSAPRRASHTLGVSGKHDKVLPSAA